MLRWQIAIQGYRGNRTIIYKEDKSHINADGLSRLPMENVKGNLAYDPEVASKIPIHFMEMNRRKNFRFFEWAREGGTPSTHLSEPGGKENPTLGMSSFEPQKEFV
ncbi:hypothetical protein O181_010658 [Austropuccinia psidii MF-1]|uniref:Uncharacterized protein n=1 Tax=Austropuccinia psidii MF-1 TaxID=1389203 RepID=A0A9Q3BTF2_9BASI|nr:hypothetical protein [Austropuccinia psidii MF-1]